MVWDLTACDSATNIYLAFKCTNIAVNGLLTFSFLLTITIILFVYNVGKKDGMDTILATAVGMTVISSLLFFAELANGYTIGFFLGATVLAAILKQLGGG